LQDQLWLDAKEHNAARLDGGANVQHLQQPLRVQQENPAASIGAKR
jgi:hypothetical protein